ncbi:MAG TPA: HSP20 family small heat-shock protein, partial [Solirubrobacteraceae bacterium]|nr:HSP20 family small heat-shock protein [Solirubrobacteraceae bacterium]
MDDMTLFFEPFAPLLGFSREADRHLASGQAALRSFAPAADVLATEDLVTVTMDIPGLKAEDLEIELADDVLTVRGERVFSYTDQAEAGVWQRLERGYGKFERVLRVPKGLEGDAIQASMADGVLTLHIPMPQARKPRRIAISTGGEQPVIEHDDAAAGEE